MLNNWEGQDRRKKIEDHDTLIRLLEIASSTTKALAEHLAEFKEHTREDREMFRRINDKLDSLMHAKYMLVGAIVVIEFVFKFLWH